MASGIETLVCAAGVEETLARVIAQIEQLGLDVFAVIDHSGAAAKAGLTMPDTKLVVFGNPKGGTPLMLAHPLVALDLPLKLLVSERDDHGASVSYNDPSYLASRYGLTEHETGPLRVVAAIARAVTSA